MNFHVTGFSGTIKEEMGRHDGYENWDVKFYENSYTSAFEEGSFDAFCKAKEDIIYLTSESENVLKTFEPNKAYVIGGLVDHNLHKGLCHKLAKEAGVSHARLPLEEFVEMKTRKVLTIDHVFQIIGEVVSQKQDWASAILKVLPSRKEVEVKESTVESTTAVDEVSLYITDHTKPSDLTNSET